MKGIALFFVLLLGIVASQEVTFPTCSGSGNQLLVDDQGIPLQNVFFQWIDIQQRYFLSFVQGNKIFFRYATIDGVIPDTEVGTSLQKSGEIINPKITYNPTNGEFAVVYRVDDSANIINQGLILQSSDLKDRPFVNAPTGYDSDIVPFHENYLVASQSDDSVVIELFNASGSSLDAKTIANADNAHLMVYDDEHVHIFYKKQTVDSDDYQTFSASMEIQNNLINIIEDDQPYIPGGSFGNVRGYTSGIKGQDFLVVLEDSSSDQFYLTLYMAKETVVVEGTYPSLLWDKNNNGWILTYQLNGVTQVSFVTIYRDAVMVTAPTEVDVSGIGPAVFGLDTNNGQAMFVRTTTPEVSPTEETDTESTEEDTNPSTVESSSTATGTESSATEVSSTATESSSAASTATASTESPSSTAETQPSTTTDDAPPSTTVGPNPPPPPPPPPKRFDYFSMGKRADVTGLFFTVICPTSPPSTDPTEPTDPTEETAATSSGTTGAATSDEDPDDEYSIDSGSESDSGISTGGKVAIAVVIILAFVGLAVLGAFVLYKKKKGVTSQEKLDQISMELDAKEKQMEV